MPIRIENFMGSFGFNARRFFPHLASAAYLWMMFNRRRKQGYQYIEFFKSFGDELPHPRVVNIETINRCNSTCDFCCANKNSDQRPFMKMEEDLFKSIIDQLSDWGYKNRLTLYGNNEPWMDTRIVELHRYAREKLPDVHIFMSTNGLLLTPEKVDAIAPYINELIINNYGETQELLEPHKKVYEYIKGNPEKFKDLDARIQIRYIHEILTNRAGAAPNKPKKETKPIREICLMPYTDMWIVPDGRLGICCCDNREVTTLADLKKTPLKEAWNSKAYQELRRRMEMDGHRDNHPFCKGCDFIDAGLRMDEVRKGLEKG